MKTGWHIPLFTLVILVSAILSGCVSFPQKGENQTISESKAPLSSPPPTTTIPLTKAPSLTTAPPPTTTPAPTTPPPTTAAPPTVPIKIVVLEYPPEAKSNDLVVMKWNVSGGTVGNISATKILWSDTKPTGYNYTYASATLFGKTPEAFIGNFTTLDVARKYDQIYYFRVYVQVDGKDYYSPEYTIDVIGPLG